MKFYQACYGKPGNNWEMLNVSQDASPAMIAFFERLGNGCTPQILGAENTVKADGSPLCLYQWMADETAICVMRAQYGERDNFGRPKMFAHGFMFEAENALENPEAILRVADSNFKFTAEETQNIPGELACEGNYSLEASLAALGMDEKAWKILMACVYSLLANPSSASLYIQCNDASAKIRNLIYCILMALPAPLRYQLSFADANSLQSAKCKRIMVVEKVPDYENFFSMETGETNMDLDEIKQEPERFPGYHAFHRLPAAGYAAYCKKVQEIAANIGYAFNAEYDELLTANRFLKDAQALAAMEEMDLTKFLLEVLVAVPNQNQFVDDYIGMVLKAIFEKGIVPNEAVMNRIEQRSDNSASADYVEYYQKLKLRFLLTKGTNDIVDFLNQQYAKSKSNFDHWHYLISGIEGGNEAIVAYYINKVLKADSYEAVHKAHQEMGALASREDLAKAMSDKCFEIVKSKMVASQMQYVDFKRVKEEYCNICNVLRIAQKSAEEFEVHKKNFWNSFKYVNFAFDSRCVENCEMMQLFGDATSARVDCLCNLYAVVQQYKINEATYYHVEKSLSEFDKVAEAPARDFSMITPMLRDYVLKNLIAERNAHFCLWYRLARLCQSKENAVWMMIQWKLPLICDSDAFEMAFMNSERMRKMADRITVYMVGADQKSGVLPKLESDPELYKTIKKEVKFMAEFKKKQAAAEKSREKELKKQEKLEKKTLKQPESAEEVDYQEPAPFDPVEKKHPGQGKDSAPKKGLFGFLGNRKK